MAVTFGLVGSPDDGDGRHGNSVRVRMKDSFSVLAHRVDDREHPRLPRTASTMEYTDVGDLSGRTIDPVSFHHPAGCAFPRTGAAVLRPAPDRGKADPAEIGRATV